MKVWGDRRFAAWVAALGLVIATYDTAALSTALPTLQHRWHLDGSQLGAVASAALIGMIVGSLLAGFLADRFGRRSVLIGDFITFGLGALACALAPNWLWLSVWRVLVGLGVGAEYAVVFPYLTENYASDRRGAVMAWALWGTSFGMVLAYAVAALTASVPFGWRLPLAGGAILAIPLVWSRRRLPESSLWHGRRSSLRRTLQILSTSNLATLWASSANWFSYQVGDQGLTLFLPVVLVELFGIKVGDAAWGSALVKAVTIPASLATVWLIETWGRRPLQVWGFLGRGLALAGLGLMTLRASGHPPVVVAAVLLGIAYAVGAMGPDKTTVIAAAEQADPNVRAMTQGVAEAWGRVGGLVGVTAFGFLSVRWGAGAGLIFFGCMAMVGFVISLWSLPETRDLAMPGAGRRPGPRWSPSR